MAYGRPSMRLFLGCYHCFFLSSQAVRGVKSSGGVIFCGLRGEKSAAKDIRDSLCWWGISDIRMVTFKLMSDILWDKIPEKKRTRFKSRLYREAGRAAGIDYSRPSRTNLAVRDHTNSDSGEMRKLEYTWKAKQEVWYTYFGVLWTEESERS